MITAVYGTDKVAFVLRHNLRGRHDENLGWTNDTVINHFVFHNIELFSQMPFRQIVSDYDDWFNIDTEIKEPVPKNKEQNVTVKLG